MKFTLIYTKSGRGNDCKRLPPDIRCQPLTFYAAIQYSQVWSSGIYGKLSDNNLGKPDP